MFEWMKNSRVFACECLFGYGQKVLHSHQIENNDERDKMRKSVGDALFSTSGD